MLIKTGRPFITFIVASYNSSKTIERMFLSVLKQTDEDFELIVIDDGSLDDTFYISSVYKEKFGKRMLLLNTTNKGPANARLTGLLYAKGQYIAFLDSDDEICTDYVKNLKGVYKEKGNHFDIIVINMEIKHLDKNKVYIHSLPCEEGVIDTHTYGYLISNGLLGYTSLKIYKRTLFNRLEGSFVRFSNLRYSEDLVMSLALYSCEDKVYYLKKSLYTYYIYKRAESIDSLNKKADDFILVIDEKYYFLKHILMLSKEEIINCLKDTIIENFYIISKLPFSDIKSHNENFFGTKIFREVFKTKKTLISILSVKNIIKMILIKIKYLFYFLLKKRNRRELD